MAPKSRAENRAEQTRALVRDVLPFLWAMIGSLILITFFPGLVLLLPRLLGYQG